MLDPHSVIDSPEAVVQHPELSREEKIAILHSWAYDAAEIEVAAEEGMKGVESDLLHRVLTALAQLGDTGDGERAGPTKQHGLP